MKKLLAILSILALSLWVAGCAKLPPWLQTTTSVVLRPGSTNLAAVVRTNQLQRAGWVTNSIQIAGATNAAGVVTPPVTRQELVPIIERVAVLSTNWEPVITPAVTVDQYAPAPAVTGAIGLAGSLAPVPWAGTAATSLTSIFLGIYAWSNKRAAAKALGEKQAALDVAIDTGKTLVANIDSLRATAKQLPGYTPEIDAKVVAGMELLQTLMGVKGTVEDLLGQHRKTAGTPTGFVAA